LLSNDGRLLFGGGGSFGGCISHTDRCDSVRPVWDTGRSSQQSCSLMACIVFVGTSAYLTTVVMHVPRSPVELHACARLLKQT
jgi:hypothetical protein